MPLKLVPPREGKTPFWSVRGTHLRVYIDRSTGLSDRKKAAKALAKIRDEIERGELTAAREPLFAVAASAYMKAGGDNRFVDPLLDKLGSLPLSKVTQDAIDGAAAELYPTGTPATRNRQVYTVVSAIMKHAGIERPIRRPRGHQGSRRITWLTPKQAEALIAKSPDPEFRALILLLLYTGLRLGEALAVEIADLHLADSFVYIPDTKTDEPRGVHLPPRVVEALSAHPRGLKRAGRLFRFTKGSSLYAALASVLTASEIILPARTGFHVLRHTWATWMRRHGGLDTRGLVGTGAWSDEASASRYAHVVASEEARRSDLLPGASIRGEMGDSGISAGEKAA